MILHVLVCLLMCVINTYVISNNDMYISAVSNNIDINWHMLICLLLIDSHTFWGFMKSTSVYNLVSKVLISLRHDSFKKQTSRLKNEINYLTRSLCTSIDFFMLKTLLSASIIKQISSYNLSHLDLKHIRLAPYQWIDFIFSTKDILITEIKMLQVFHL